MPVYDGTTLTKIAAIKTLANQGKAVEVHEIVRINWFPGQYTQDDTKYYGVHSTAEVASTPPPSIVVEDRIIPGGSPDWFLPTTIDATIGDEEVTIEMWDADDGISSRLVDFGEGMKCILYYWFPVQNLLLPWWEGHLRLEDEARADTITITIAQGFRSSDVNVPGRPHYANCTAIFGGLLTTQAEIDEHGCPYNKQSPISGAVGNNNPSTGQPWTFCNRLNHASCSARGVDPNFHLSHNTVTSVVVNNQTQGPTLYSTSQGNETNLKEPVTVIMGHRRKYDMKVMAFRRDLNNNNPDHAWFLAMYEGCEGPISSFSNVRVTVGGREQAAVGMHYNYRLGTLGQTPYPSGATRLTEHSYSGTAHILYNFGWTNPADLGPGDASATAFISGLNNIRVYSTTSAYTSVWTSNRVWQIARILCDKRWGYGLDYARLDIQSFIDAAAWAETAVTFTDDWGNAWHHTRADSHIELIGKKVQQQVEDICRAGRLSRPFLFNGKIHIVPLKALSSGDLSAAPVFTDTGDTRNIIFEENDGVLMSTLTIKRESDLDLVNRVECVFDDIENDYLERPLAPIEDVVAQLKAGRVIGEKARKTNSKKYNLPGVINEAQAMKMAWSLLDLGEFDEGGLQNNLRITFKAWFSDALELHQEKVIKVVSSRLTKYGFEYFRVKKMERQADLCYEIEAQAYNSTYMDAFETTYTAPDPLPNECSIDTDCPPGYVCVGGVCVYEGGPVCRQTFGNVRVDDGYIYIPIDPC